jgi:hypothetical protein
VGKSPRFVGFRFPAFPLSDLAAAPPRCVLCGKISPVIPMALALFAYFAWFAVKISAFPLCSLRFAAKY